MYLMLVMSLLPCLYLLISLYLGRCSKEKVDLVERMCGLDNTITRLFIMSKVGLRSHILRRTIVFRMLADYHGLLWIDVDRFRQPSLNH